MNTYAYTAVTSQANSALSEWTFNTHRTCESWVIPDGCRDLIVRDSIDTGSSWFVSELSHTAYLVSSTAGTRFRGIRLKPGTHIHLHQLHAWLNGREVSELFESDQIDEFCVRISSLSNALACLASDHESVHSVATELGVSQRSLQRLVKGGTGQSPHYWLSLARIRKAARSLFDGDCLSDVAGNAGFADQAHMNREIKKWFGHTPTQIQADYAMFELLSESGYG